MRFAYSYSRINIFEKCPKAFEFKFIQKLQEPQTPALLVGSKFHEIAADYNKYLAKNKIESDLQYLRTLIKKKADLPDEMNDDLISLLYSFSDYYSLEKSDIITVENDVAFNEKWETVDWLANDVFFRLKMDLMMKRDKVVLIRDFKTDRWLPPASVINNSFQLELYALAVSKLYSKLDNIIVELDYVRYRVRRSRVIDLSEVSFIEEKLMKKINKIENTNHFKPRLSSYCEWCGFKNLCPAYKEYKYNLRINDIKDNKTATEIAEKIWIAEQFIKQAKDKLKVFIQQNKGIQIGDMLLDFHRSEKIKITDVENIVNELIRLGIEKQKIWGKITLSPTAVKSLLKNNKEYIPLLLKKYAMKQVSSTFKFQKIKE